MLLASFQSTSIVTRCLRAATFPTATAAATSASAVANNCVRRVSRQLARSTTTTTTTTAMASMCSKEDPSITEPAKTVTMPRTTTKQTNESADEKPAAAANATKECPSCKGSGTIPDVAPQKSAVDIDGNVDDKFHQLPPLPENLPPAHPDFVHCMPPEAPTYRKFSIFTAGSIEMGKAVQWQKLMASMLSHLPITVNNPRRGHWDPNATQEAKNADFRHQVQWELSALEQADVICFFFDVNTMSPVTMLELGLWAASKKVVVCCDKRFWRGGNVDLVCQRYNVPLVHTFAELVPAVEAMLKDKGMLLDSQGNLVGPNEHAHKELKKEVLSS